MAPEEKTTLVISILLVACITIPMLLGAIKLDHALDMKNCLVEFSQTTCNHLLK